MLGLLQVIKTALFLAKKKNLSANVEIFFDYTEAVVCMWSVKKVFLEISQNSLESTCARVSLLIKLQASVCNFIKRETLAQVFSCEFCEIFKNIFFNRTPPDDCFWL